jgi:Protein of unknown function (DUF1570)
MITSWRDGQNLPPLDSEVLSRRSLLSGALLALAGLASGSAPALAQSKTASPTSEAEEIAAAEKVARDGKLGPLRHSTSEHFLAVGNAPDEHRKAALRLCESLGGDFLAHFRALGFKLKYPDYRLTIVTLKDATSYAVFLGKEPIKDEGGCYDLVTGRLLIFDIRSDPADLAAPETRANLFSLVHETAHQLSFNTGLLNAENNVPLCLSEGIATYVELWQPRVKNAIGGINRPRLAALEDAWIPIQELLADDKAFSDPKTVQLAYAESWLLVHHLLKTPSRLPRFRDYLAAASHSSKPEDSVKLAEKFLGSLTKLDRDVKNEARRLVVNRSGRPH